MKTMIAIAMAGLLTAFTAQAEEEHKHGEQVATTTIQGEVVDVFCYVGHGAKGSGHANCAKKCIEAGLPVGILTDDGKLYLAAGDHTPMNKELAKHAAQQVKATGKVASRSGVNLIEITKLEPVK
jgi:hypothetical protein